MVFQTVFVISCNIMDRGLGGGWGKAGAGAGGKPKAGLSNHSDSKRSAVPSVCGTNHKGGQDWHKEQPGTPCSPINASQDHEMHSCVFTASIKSCL